MEVLPFKAEHLRSMQVQSRQTGLEWLITDQALKGLEDSEAYTGIINGEVVACAGAYEVAHKRFVAWAYLGVNARKHMLSITRAIQMWFSIFEYRRLEAHIDCDFKEAHRWIQMFGFKLECERMKSFTPDGRDCALYVIVR